MKHFLLLNQDPALRRSLERYVRARGADCASHPLGFRTSESGGEPTPSWVVNRYEEACSFIDGQLDDVGDFERDRVFAVVDFFDPLFRGNPDESLSIPFTFSSMALVGMLVLTYPEIHWILISSGECSICDRPGFKAIHDHNMLTIANVAELLDDALTGVMCPPEFDPTGLRRLVRGFFRPAVDYADIQKAIQGVGIVLDEEYSFASLVALATYRTGIPTRLISTERLARHWLGGQAAGDTARPYWPAGRDSGERIEISVEDVYVSFPDSSNHDWASLPERDKVLEGLAASRKRYLLTVGQGRGGGERIRWKSNLQYLRRDFRNRSGVIHKPVAGVHQLLRITGLKRPSGIRKRRGTDSCSDLGHSVEGRVALICENLLKRSSARLERARSVEAAIVAAVIAIDARALLASHAPTLALEAVALQHDAEVQAESSFIGIAHSLRIDLRIREIRKDCRRISRWFSRKTRLLNEINARLSIVDRIATRFASNNQADEAEECRGAARILRANYMACSSFSGVLTWPLRMYIAQCLRSLGRFLFALLAWFMVFAWYLFSYRHESPPKCPVETSILDTAYLFISGDVPPSSEACQQIPAGFMVFVCVIALIHTGLLVSHIYTMASRR